MKRIQYYSIVAALLLAGCIREPAAECPCDPMPFAPVSVRLGAADDGTSTRSQLAVSGAERFNKAMLFAFDHATGRIITEGGSPCVKYTETIDFSWALPLGKALDICTVVNYGDLDLDGYAGDGDLTRSALSDALVFSCTPSSFLNLDDSGYGIPMAGILENKTLSSGQDPLTIRVQKLFARYDFYFDLTGLPAGRQFSCAEVRAIRSNTEVPFFRSGFRQTALSRLTALDSATEAECFRASAGGATNTVTIYLPENCQGDKTLSRSWTEWGALGANGASDLALCSYVDFDIETRDEWNQLSARSYRLYPGTDIGPAQRNFDVVRNRKQTVGLRLATVDPPVSIALDVGSAVYLPTTGTVLVRYGANGFSSADEVLDYSNGKPSGVTLSAKTLSGGPMTIDGVSYERSGTLTFSTTRAPMGRAFLLKIGNTALRATDSRNAVILPEGISFAGENRVYMPGCDPEEESVELVSADAYALNPSDFSGLSVAFSREVDGVQTTYGASAGTLSFAPASSGRYYLKVRIPYAALPEGRAYELRGPGSILARAQDAQGEPVCYKLGDATVRLDLAVCSFLTGSSCFSRTSNLSASRFPPYATYQSFLCPGVYDPADAAAHFTFGGYEGEDPDLTGHFCLPFRVSMDPTTIHTGGGYYYTINERGSEGVGSLHVPCVTDGYKRGTCLPVYIYEQMDEHLVGSDWYDTDIDDWSETSVWYDAANRYSDDIFPYSGMWSIYWRGLSIPHSYTGGDGCAPDDHYYQDIDVITFSGYAQSPRNYYLRVYDWTEGELDAIAGDLIGLYD